MKLDQDVARIVQRRMRMRQTSFDQALNEPVRVGCASLTGTPEFRTSTVAMDQSTVNLDKGFQLTAKLEDDDLVGESQGRECS